MLILHLRDSHDAHIAVKGRISVIDNNNDSRGYKKLILKNNAAFRSCTAKINNTLYTIQKVLIL